MLSSYRLFIRYAFWPERAPPLHSSKYVVWTLNVPPENASLYYDNDSLSSNSSSFRTFCKNIHIGDILLPSPSLGGPFNLCDFTKNYQINGNA